MRTNRRHFLRAGLAGGLALSAMPFPSYGMDKSKVSLTQGDDHIDNIFKALSYQKDEIRRAIGDKKVVLKPNNVSITNQLAATHADALIGTLEFLHSIGVKDIAIAESAAPGPTMEGFVNFGYDKVAAKYNVQMLDLDTLPVEKHYVVSDEDFHPKAVRMSSLLLDRKNTFLISNAVMKTHDRVVATLSLKNIIFGAPIKDEGFAWGKGKPGARSDKSIAHGGGTRGINYNIFQLSYKLHPDLAVIDGYTGMEGNGPVGGTPVEHRVAVASMDWLAADRLGIELMGIPYENVGWMNYCSDAGLGQTDLSQMEILGESVQGNIKTYKLSDQIQGQLIWKEPMKIIAG